MRLVVAQKINILLISDLASFFSKVTSKFKCTSHIYLKRDFKTRGLPGFTDCYFQVSVCTRFLPHKAQLIPSSCRWSENRAIITDSIFPLSLTVIWAGVGIDFHQAFLDRWFGWFLNSYAGFPMHSLQVKAVFPPPGGISQFKDSLLSCLPLPRLAAEETATVDARSLQRGLR